MSAYHFDAQAFLSLDKLGGKHHHADPDKLVFAMIKPRWYPNLVGSAREERYGHRDGCL
jgi:hypothetical protein